MNAFEKALIQYFGKPGLRKIQSTVVGIAGLGGLGSNCAVSLVRSGFRKFILADFDKVEYGNLNRQFYFLDQAGLYKTDCLKANLSRINPNLDITLVRQKISEDNAAEVFADCGVVVEAFDKAEYKCLMAQVFLGSPKLLVSASGLAGWGNSDALRIKKIKDNCFLIGDSYSEATGSLPPCAPKVAIAAAKQADVILSWVLGQR
ncbi:MAG: sulfur carrier protein ThiS adenylyltransferase ThiF [Candidatus Omnitrophica bacterium]|nr:sulfur carrier protein ThiS adenylyltransferase ThiF [Candidatus Omnitrophota bacterium]